MTWTALIIDFFLALLAVIFVYFWSKSIFITSSYYGLTDVFNLTESKISRSTFWIFYIPVFIVFAAMSFMWLNWYFLTNSIWIVAVFFWVILYFYIAFILQRRQLLSLQMFFIYSITSSAISYLIYSLGISKGLSGILPDNTNLRADFWLLFLFFIVNLIQEIAPKFQPGAGNINRYAEHRYKKLSKKFGYLIKEEHNHTIRKIVYAIMIYEDYERPKFFRFFEKIMSVSNKAKTTGIMQVTSAKVLSDEESIKKAHEIINTKYSQLKESNPSLNEDEVMYRILSEYNNAGSYTSNTLDILAAIDKIIGK